MINFRKLGLHWRVGFFINRIREQLWVKPLATCVLSIIGVFISKLADNTFLFRYIPHISEKSVESLLSIMASSMLMIATFAVTSMVGAYSSASNTASPRSFSLVIADDVSQRALSAFIGAFIFSIVGLIAAKNSYFGSAGLFVLFLLTIMVFGIVIYTFVRWVDRIARLGRLGNTIDKVEQATAASLQKRKRAPALNGVPAGPRPFSGLAIYARSVGYVQQIDINALQSLAEKVEARIQVAVLPGSFITPERPLAYLNDSPADKSDFKVEKAADAFLIGRERVYDEDPRYGLVVLSQIAGRALSPAVNDPGTAIDIIGILVRLFVLWGSQDEGEQETTNILFDRVDVPELSVRDMFDDAFTAIARDGGNTVEVAIWLQKAFASFASMDDPELQDAAIDHSRRALASAEKSLVLQEDINKIREIADFAFNKRMEET